jgi:hypothetical protein
VASAADALVIVFAALAPDEQDDAFQRLRQVLTARDAAEESVMGRCIRSLLRVTEVIGHVPSVGDYREASKALREVGEDVESFANLYKNFGGSWPRAMEALELSETTTAERIAGRFASRKVGKVWRYSPERLREVLLAAAAHWGRPPSVAEFEFWRERELELLRAAGDPDTHLPSSSPYRRRWGGWEAALLALGFAPEEVALRLEHTERPRRHEPDAYLPEDLVVAELSPLASTSLVLDILAMGRLRTAYASLPKRSRYVLTARLGLGGVKPLTLKQTAEPLGLHLTTVHQVQAHAVEDLCRAVAHRKGQDPESVREDVLSVLRAIARLP